MVFYHSKRLQEATESDEELARLVELTAPKPGCVCEECETLREAKK